MAKIIFRLTPGESLEFSLHQGATRLGRHHGNQIVINNTWISSLHAEFRRTGGAISVHDLGSSNGTLVNGEVVHERELRDGDRLGFGQLEAIYDAEVEMPSETASMAATPEIADTAGAPGAAISKPLVSKPSPAAEAVVAVSQVAAPPTIVADDTRKKESTRELEVLQKSLAQTTAATARAVQEQAEAEAILFSTRSAVAAAQLALVAAEAPLYDIKQAAETARLAAEAARLAAGEEASRAAASQESAMATAQRLAAEIDTLTTRSEEIRSAMTGQEATAKQQDLEAAKVLQDHRGELADLQNAVTATREELREIQSGKCTAGAALTATRTELQETHAAKLIARSELQETEAAAADARTALQETQLAATAARKALHESQTAVLAARAAAEELSATITTAGAELLAIQENLSQSRAATALEDGKMLAQQEALETLELQQSILGSKISSWEKREAAVASAEAKLQEKEVAKVSLRQEWQEIEMARDAAQLAVTTALAAQSTLAGESAALQARLEHLRRETDGAEALNSKVTDLRQQQAEAGRRLEYLNDRLAGMSEAPDPNWGTVHTLARSFIKKLDLIDDLIAHLSGQPASTATLEQLSVFRCGLLDVLKEYSIESYSLEPGTVIDVAARKRIQIVESLSEGSHDGTRIVRTYRPGYVCLNGDLGISTLLRKADVAVSIPLG